MIATNMPGPITVPRLLYFPSFFVISYADPCFPLVGIQLSPLKRSHNFRMVGTGELLKSTIRSVVPFVRLLS